MRGYLWLDKPTMRMLLYKVRKQYEGQTSQENPLIFNVSWKLRWGGGEGGMLELGCHTVNISGGLPILFRYASYLLLGTSALLARGFFSQTNIFRRFSLHIIDLAGKSCYDGRKVRAVPRFVCYEPQKTGARSALGT
jgi:hypothetical protein